MARDFLPICDLVLFFFPATSPLDNTDMPLLSELHRRLPFIPMLFVITRADELRRNREKQLSDENLDPSKSAQFLTKVMSRITTLLKSQNRYNENDFILIDNHAAYNIESLKQTLLSRVEPGNLDARLSMHSYKVAFFLRTAETLRDYFSSFLDAKLTELNRIVESADKNMRKYQDSVMVSNNNLTHSWFASHTTIQELKTKAADRLRNIDELPLSLFKASTISNS